MNNIKKYQFLIFITICLSLILTQTYSITGTIIDDKTNKPISNVNIYNDDFAIKTVSDQEGIFVLKLNNYIESTIDLNIQIIGYNTKVVTLELLDEKFDLGKVSLTTHILESDLVLIHSHKDRSNQISDIVLIGRNLDNNLNGNIATTISNQPNVGINSFGSVTSKPVLRGFSSDRLLITKDGNTMGDLSQSSIDHVITLDMTEINGIEIIRGPKSLIYGSNAIGGVINTTINGNPKLRVDKFFKKIHLGSESFNSGIYGNLIFYIPIEDYQINISLNNRNTNNQSSPIGRLDNTYSQTSNYKIGLTKYSNNGYINFLIENFDMNYGIPPSPEGHINGVDIGLIKNTFQFNLHKHVSIYNFDQFDIKYNFIDYEHKEFENNLDYFSVKLSRKTHNLKIELNSSNFILGSEFQFNQFLPAGFYWTPKTDELDFSVYGFYDKQFDGFELLSSFRIGQLSIIPEKYNLSFSNLDIEKIIDRNFNYLSYSLGLKKIINKFEFDTWIMSTMRAPKIEELYSDGPHLGSYAYEIGEPNLDLEKIYGIESSLSYNSNPFFFSITSFYNYSPYYYQMSKMGQCNEEFIPGESHPCAGEDFIEWGVGSSGWLYKYRTQGVEAIIKGLELNLTYHYKNLKVTYDFSLVNGDNLQQELPLSYMNPTKQILNFEYTQRLFNYNIRFSKIHSQHRLGEFESFTPSAKLIDIVMSYSKNNHKITIQLKNILNEEYYNHLSKIKSIMPEAGRNLVISYKLFF